MKYNGLIFVIFATIFVAQNEANPTDSLNAIDESIVATTNYLRNTYAESFRESTHKTILAVVDFHRDNVSDKIKRSFNEFIQKFSESENEGKSVDRCRNVFKSAIDAAQEKLAGGFDKCLIDHAPDWKSSGVLLESTISEGEKILADIKKIKEECHSEDNSATQKCILMKLPVVGQSIGSYKRNVAEIKKIFFDISDSAIGQTGRCVMRPLDNFEDEIASAKNATIECIGEATPIVEV